MIHKPNSGIVAQARAGLKWHGLDEYPGFCYFLKLPTGHVKIGFTHTRMLVKGRAAGLSVDYGGTVTELLVLKGGWVAEAYYHDMFQELRVDGKGERFRYEQPLIDFIEENQSEHVGLE